MALIRRGRLRPEALPPEDLALAVFGPWDPRAGCDAQPTVLFSPRCETSQLRLLWTQHRAAIEAAATAAGVNEPWVKGRLWFCDQL